MNSKSAWSTGGIFLASALMAAPLWADIPVRQTLPVQLAQAQGAARDGDMERGRKYAEEETREQRREMEDATRGTATRQREELQTQERSREMEQEHQGSEQLRQRKSEQEQKELGKGSEQGQEAREQRKKWWRFWE